MNCFCLAASTLPGGVEIPLEVARAEALVAEGPDRTGPDCVVVVCSFLSAISI
jgi:hypothetical protein